jgi:tryptophan-rich sensory protein
MEVMGPSSPVSAAGLAKGAAVAGATALVAGGGAALSDFESGWYRRLRKPAWQPSGRTIGRVWSVLYALTAASGTMLWTGRSRPRSRLLPALFVAQYALNLAYTPLLTRGRSLRLATLDSGLLFAAVAALIRTAWPARRVAAALLLPYLAWTGFATFLSWRILRLNRPRTGLPWPR